MSSNKSVEFRFEEKVDRSGGEDACHPWLAGLSNGGYGRFSDDKGHVYAHRFAWIRAHGPVAREVFICHHCDNPRCVNLKHLFLGSAALNMQDKCNKGRQSKGASHGKACEGRLVTNRGEANSMSKLSTGDVECIRKLASLGRFTNTEIAGMFKLSASQVGNIVANRAWGHL